MLHIFVPLLFQFIYFRLELPLVLFAVLYLVIDAHGTLANVLLLGRVLHKRVVVVVSKET